MKAQEALVKYSKLSPVIVRLVSKIKADPEAMATLTNAKGDYSAMVFIELLPFFAKCDEVYEMVAIYKDKTIDEIKNEEFSDFTSQLKEMMMDSNLVSFIKPQV